MIRALIFDMDGTLVDSEKLHYEAWKKTVLRYGVNSLNCDTFINYIGTSNEKLAGDYISNHKLDVDVDFMVREKQNFYLEMIPDIEQLPGVREIIHRCHGRYIIAIAAGMISIAIPNAMLKKAVFFQSGHGHCSNRPG